MIDSDVTPNELSAKVYLESKLRVRVLLLITLKTITGIVMRMIIMKLQKHLRENIIFNSHTILGAVC